MPTGGIIILRVVAGSAKGLKLQTLEGAGTRPTTDRVKENLFNILAPYIENSKVLDLFAGSGSLGIEALSRGAESAVFSDQNEKCIQIIEKNLEHTKMTEKAGVFLGEAALIIFLDPPYKKGIIPLILQHLEEYGVLDEKFIIIAETDISDELPESTGCMVTSKVQVYGSTKLTFYKRN